MATADALLRYLRNNRPPPRPVARPPAAPPPYNPYTAAGPPPMPNTAVFNKLFPEYTTRSEAQWQELLDARMRPYQAALDQQRAVEMGISEFRREQAERTNQGLSEGFLKVLTGGRTGAEAEQYAKEQFGGQYLPAQAMTIAADRLSQLTADYDERDWEITSEYMRAMAEIPGIREQLRADIQNQDADEYDRKFKYVSLLLDQAWQTYEQQSQAYTQASQLRAADAAIRREQGLTGYTNRKDAVAEATKYTDDTGFIYKVRKTKGGWEAYPTKQRKPKPANQSKPSAAMKNSAIQEAKYLTSNDTNVWRVRKRNGLWEPYRTNQKRAGGAKPNAGLSQAQQEEARLLREFQENKDKYAQKTEINPDFKPGDPEYKKVTGMPYDQAFAELYDYVLAALAPYGRSPSYVRNWVRSRLNSIYPGQAASAAKPRGG